MAIHIDWYALMAMERGKPHGWTWVRLTAIGESREHGAIIVKGGVPGAVYKSGPRKGKPNRSKDTDKSEMVVTFRELDERKLLWEREHGSCHECGGDGQEIMSVGVDGTKTRTCRRCKGSGKAPQAVATSEVAA